MFNLTQWEIWSYLRRMQIKLRKYVSIVIYFVLQVLWRCRRRTLLRISDAALKILRRFHSSNSNKVPVLGL